MEHPILVVDDDAAIQEFISLALREEDYPVITATDGAEALTITAQHRPQLILLDIQMPRMDGRAFVEAYRQTLGPLS
jgi:two-component system, OmpR family, KDP operon response regulator KdpE